ncbi:hypothetical protein J6590_068888 [Homalodisca vitripennis]|nr:hypothetical protein J6590_068888 [Homalodisca vitripennis]
MGEQTNRGSLIEEINSTTFVQKSFSSATKLDPTAMMTVPPSKPRTTKTNEKPEVLFHPNLMVETREDKLNRWVKKLYQIRQRSINGTPMEV